MSKVEIGIVVLICALLVGFALLLTNAGWELCFTSRGYALCAPR